MPWFVGQRVDLEPGVADAVERRLVAVGHDDEPDVAHGLGEDGLHGAADVLGGAVEGHADRDGHDPSAGKVDAMSRSAQTRTSGSRPKL